PQRRRPHRVAGGEEPAHRAWAEREPRGHQESDPRPAQDEREYLTVAEREPGQADGRRRAAVDGERAGPEAPDGQQRRDEGAAPQGPPRRARASPARTGA